MRRRYRSINPRKKLLLSTMFWLLMMLIAIFFVDLKMRPIIKTSSAYQAKIIATNAINDAIEREISQMNISGGSLAALKTNSAGDVIAIEMNSVATNQLKLRLVSAVMKELGSIEQKDIKLPIGTLFGGQFLSGRGPKIEFRVIPAGYVTAELKNSFQQAGINQTLHQVILHMNVSITAIIPGFSSTTDVETDFCVAQTVIVGKVPDSFTEVNGDDSSTISKINDYGNEKQ